MTRQAEGFHFGCTLALAVDALPLVDRVKWSKLERQVAFSPLAQNDQ